MSALIWIAAGLTGGCCDTVLRVVRPRGDWLQEQRCSARAPSSASGRWIRRVIRRFATTLAAFFVRLRLYRPPDAVGHHLALRPDAADRRRSRGSRRPLFVDGRTPARLPLPHSRPPRVGRRLALLDWQCGASAPGRRRFRRTRPQTTPTHASRGRRCRTCVGRRTLCARHHGRHAVVRMVDGEERAERTRRCARQ